MSAAASAITGGGQQSAGQSPFGGALLASIPGQSTAPYAGTYFPGGAPPAQSAPWMQGGYGWGGVGGYAPMSNVFGGQWEPTQAGGSTYNFGSPEWGAAGGPMVGSPMMSAFRGGTPYGGGMTASATIPTQANIGGLQSRPIAAMR